MNKELKEALNKRLVFAEDWALTKEYHYTIELTDSVTGVVLYVTKAIGYLYSDATLKPTIRLGGFTGAELEEDSVELFLEHQKKYSKVKQARAEKELMLKQYKALGVEWKDRV